jgi:hypothetical protein
MLGVKFNLQTLFDSCPFTDQINQKSSEFRTDSNSCQMPQLTFSVDCGFEIGYLLFDCGFEIGSILFDLHHQ